LVNRVQIPAEHLALTKEFVQQCPVFRRPGMSEAEAMEFAEVVGGFEKDSQALDDFLAIAMEAYTVHQWVEGDFHCIEYVSGCEQH
jgi:hypothetical protein